MDVVQELVADFFKSFASRPPQEYIPPQIPTSPPKVQLYSPGDFESVVAVLSAFKTFTLESCHNPVLAHKIGSRDEVQLTHTHARLVHPEGAVIIASQKVKLTPPPLSQHVEMIEWIDPRNWDFTSPIIVSIWCDTEAGREAACSSVKERTKSLGMAWKEALTA